MEQFINSSTWDEIKPGQWQVKQQRVRSLTSFLVRLRNGIWRTILAIIGSAILLLVAAIPLRITLMLEALRQGI